MTAQKWFHPRGSLSLGGWESVVDASLEGWRHTGLRVADLAGGSVDLGADRVERMIIPLHGSFSVRTDDEVFSLLGRASVFDGPTDVLYLGVDTAARVTGSGRLAVAEAPATRALPPRYLPRQEVPVEIRGSGQSTRQVHNFGTPGALDTEKLIVCEVVTPAGNWSSFPAHKHDQTTLTESRLEEIYYFESAVERGRQAPDAADPFGMFATYSSAAGPIDVTALVRTGDIALVPYGYHGPAAAAPGYDLYYLNVMAGPDPERSWKITDDPAHGWIRDSWVGQTPDARLPYIHLEENPQ